jgi:hypothetical protein
MSSIKRIIQSVAVGVVLMQLSSGFGVATAGAQEPENFPAEEFDLNPDEMDLDFNPDEMDLDFGAMDFDPEEPDRLAAESAAMLGVMLVIYGIIIAIALAVFIFVLWFLSSALAAVPQQYRDMESARVWLLLIPLFNLIWMFLVTGRISSSYQRYFAAQGITTYGDCGAAIGMWCCICALLCFIPCVNIIAGPAFLILLIIFLVKISGMKKQVGAAPAGTGQ